MTSNQTLAFLEKNFYRFLFQSKQEKIKSLGIFFFPNKNPNSKRRKTNANILKRSMGISWVLPDNYFAMIGSLNK